MSKNGRSTDGIHITLIGNQARDKTIRPIVPAALILPPAVLTKICVVALLSEDFAGRVARFHFRPVAARDLTLARSP
jgi:hypothetical protein